MPRIDRKVKYNKKEKKKCQGCSNAIFPWDKLKNRKRASKQIAWTMKRRLERKRSKSNLCMRATGAKVPPRRNAALLSANYPAATNFPLPSPSRVLLSPPPIYLSREHVPRKKNTRLGGETLPRSEQIRLSSLSRNSFFPYIIPLIDRFIIDVRSILVPF